MKYVMSDIHGRFDKYASMLEVIQFSKEDELYILGDVIDRGKDGIAILMDIMNRSNVHMLLGNHEFMAVQTIFSKDKKEMLNWMWNGGRNTYDDLMQLPQEEVERIILYLLNLPSFIELEVRNQKFY